MAHEASTEAGTTSRTQVEYHYILSLAWSINGRPAQGSYAGVFTTDPFTTTEDAAYQRIYDATRERMNVQGPSTILFYRLTKNVVLS